MNDTDYLTDEELDLLYTFEALLVEDNACIDDLLMDESGYEQLVAIAELGREAEMLLEGK